VVWKQAGSQENSIVFYYSEEGDDRPYIERLKQSFIGSRERIAMRSISFFREGDDSYIRIQLVSIYEDIQNFNTLVKRDNRELFECFKPEIRSNNVFFITLPNDIADNKAHQEALWKLINEVKHITDIPYNIIRGIAKHVGILPPLSCVEDNEEKSYREAIEAIDRRPGVLLNPNAVAYKGSYTSEVRNFASLI
tara:strand:+ start:568 stop:1149 length:582 start_codon:yes stop_codon:yes gene_type:complete